MNETTAEKIKTDIEKHYRSMQINDICVNGEGVDIDATTKHPEHFEFVANRILMMHKEIRIVIFHGKVMDYAYTRETLKWLGFNSFNNQ